MSWLPEFVLLLRIWHLDLPHKCRPSGCMQKVRKILKIAFVPFYYPENTVSEPWASLVPHEIESDTLAKRSPFIYTEFEPDVVLRLK